MLGIFRYWLTGEYNEIDREWLLTNLYNRRLSMDSTAPREKWLTVPALAALPECLLLEIVETHDVLTSWGVSSPEAIGRIERYRAKYFGADTNRGDLDLAAYLGYRLPLENRDWTSSPSISRALVERGIAKCRRFLAKNPPTGNGYSLMNPFQAVSVPSSSLVAQIDDVDCVRSTDRPVLDQLQMYYLPGDAHWHLLHNRKGAHWVYQGYGLVRDASVVKAIITSETRYTFGPLDPELVALSRKHQQARD